VKSRLLSYLLFCVIATLFVMGFAFVESASDHRLPVPLGPSKGLPMATEDRVREADWWPTKGTAALEDFVGNKACAECHGGKVATQKTTPMAGASALIGNSPVLKSHESLSGKLNDFTYLASFKNGEATLTPKPGQYRYGQSPYRNARTGFRSTAPSHNSTPIPCPARSS